MYRNRSTLVTLTLIGILLAAFAAAQSADPWIGTWKLNLAKSKYDPGPAPKSQTLKIEAVAGGGQKHTFDGVNAEGEKTHSERTAKFDGTDVPVQAVAPPPTTMNTNAFQRTGDRSFEVTGKVDGKPGRTTTRVTISADGKTMTQTVTGTNAQGKQVNNIVVYEKQ
jgi:hypothetical protein